MNIMFQEPPRPALRAGQGEQRQGEQRQPGPRGPRALDPGSGGPAAAMRSRRRRLLVWSAAPACLVVAAAAKLLSLGLLSGQASAAFAAADADAARSAAGWLLPLNIVEPHKAPFAAGDADVLDGDFRSARGHFAEALTLVAPDALPDACMVRVNLVLATERLGDETADAGDPASAADLYAQAMDAVKAAPAGCAPGESPERDSQSAQAGERLGEAGRRLAGKLGSGKQDAATADPQDTTEADPEDAAQQDRLDQLEESGRQSQRERNTGREREEYLNDSGYAEQPERPW